MTSEIKEYIQEWNNLSSNYGIYIQKMLKKCGIDNVYQGIFDLLTTNDIELFEQTLTFTLFIIKQTDFIPGNEDQKLAEKFNSSPVFTDCFHSLISHKKYAHINIMLGYIKEGLIDISKEEVFNLIAQYKDENPIIILSLISYANALEYDSDDNLYKFFSFDDKKLEFILKFLYITAFNSYDPFLVDEKLQALKEICPSEYSGILSKAIESNKKYLKEYDNPDALSEEEADLTEIEIMMEDYFDQCAEFTVDEKVYTFNQYLAEKQ